MAKRFKPSAVTKADLVKELRQLAHEIGKTPSQSDMKDGSTTLVKKVHLYRKMFGSIKAAQEAAGLTPNSSGTDTKYSEKELIENIVRLYGVLGAVPSQTDINKHDRNKKPQGK